MTEEGVLFRSSYDGAAVELTPERAVPSRSSSDPTSPWCSINWSAFPLLGRGRGRHGADVAMVGAGLGEAT